MVFQSETANRARLPSRMKTPAYICEVLVEEGARKGGTYVAAHITA
jgi:hypothetical protein